MAQAKEGDKVKVNYTGSLEDGTVFGSSSAEDPLEFTIGQRKVLPSFENALVGIKKGDTKTVSIHPEEAFGNSREDLIFNVARTKLPSNIDLKLGGILRVGSDAGKGRSGYHSYKVLLVWIGCKCAYSGNTLLS